MEAAVKRKITIARPDQIKQRLLSKVASSSNCAFSKHANALLRGSQNWTGELSQCSGRKVGCTHSPELPPHEAARLSLVGGRASEVATADEGARWQACVIDKLV